MNLLLVTAAEAAAQPLVLTDARADHVRDVLRARIGDRVRVGILDGPLGQGLVQTIHPELRLACTFDAAAPPRSADTLLLAVPRPVVLQRCLAQAAALGFGQIVLFRSRHVDKSHLASRHLAADAVRRHVRDGLSQARRTRLPDVVQFPRFRPFVEDALAGLLPAGPRFVADPDAPVELASLPVAAGAAFSLAIGPERGFTEYEVRAFAAAGFTPVRAGPYPLRVETAVAYLSGQVHACRHAGTMRPDPEGRAP